MTANLISGLSALTRPSGAYAMLAVDQREAMRAMFAEFQGDIIAFQTTDQTTGTTSWGLASQNAGGVNALWSYGADT